jgi:hypothetical protein
MTKTNVGCAWCVADFSEPTAVPADGRSTAATSRAASEAPGPADRVTEGRAVRRRREPRQPQPGGRLSICLSRSSLLRYGSRCHHRSRVLCSVFSAASSPHRIKNWSPKNSTTIAQVSVEPRRRNAPAAIPKNSHTRLRCVRSTLLGDLLHTRRFWFRTRQSRRFAEFDIFRRNRTNSRASELILKTRSGRRASQ